MVMGAHDAETMEGLNEVADIGDRWHTSDEGLGNRRLGVAHRFLCFIVRRSGEAVLIRALTVGLRVFSVQHELAERYEKAVVDSAIDEGINMDGFARRERRNRRKGVVVALLLSLLLLLLLVVVVRRNKRGCTGWAALGKATRAAILARQGTGQVGREGAVRVGTAAIRLRVLSLVLAAGEAVQRGDS
jgi:hypothetical protein